MGDPHWGNNEMDNIEPGKLPNALAFAGRGYGVLPLYGIVDGKCECISSGKHPHSKLANVLTMDEARWIAANIAKLPKYLAANPLTQRKSEGT